MTYAEVILWKHALRASSMLGYPFRRQRPVLNFIADFMCKNLNLIIEVDGGSHLWEGADHRDKSKQKKLEEAGFTVIRFKDDEVLNRMEEVIKRIKDTIRDIERARTSMPQSNCPPPYPPPAGETTSSRETPQ
jgi:very-short-patch-repair endonuclease